MGALPSILASIPHVSIYLHSGCHHMTFCGRARPPYICVWWPLTSLTMQPLITEPLGSQPTASCPREFLASARPIVYCDSTGRGHVKSSGKLVGLHMPGIASKTKASSMTPCLILLLVLIFKIVLHNRLEHHKRLPALMVFHGRRQSCAMCPRLHLPA